PLVTSARTPLDPARRVYDGAGEPCRVTAEHFGRLLRKLRIFRWLDRLEFDSFIDVASGWEHVPHLVRERYGVPAFYSDMVHELNLATEGPRFGKVDHAVTLQLPTLPFRDEAFDVVLCSEVFEHLVRPVDTLVGLAGGGGGAPGGAPHRGLGGLRRRTAPERRDPGVAGGVRPSRASPLLRLWRPGGSARAGVRCTRCARLFPTDPTPA